MINRSLVDLRADERTLEQQIDAVHENYQQNLYQSEAQEAYFINLIKQREADDSEVRHQVHRIADRQRDELYANYRQKTLQLKEQLEVITTEIRKAT